MSHPRPYRPHLESLEDRYLLATYFVTPVGNNANPGTAAQPFASIQYALNVATQPGDTVQVHAGTYREKLNFPASGTAAGGAITLQAAPGERVVLRGRGVPGQDMVRMQDVSYVRLVGLEITDNRNVRDGAGVRVTGAGSHIEIRNNVIHHLRGRNATGISVYGTRIDAAVAGLVIDGNTIFRVDAFPSEALVLNGNVTDFVVSNNTVRNVNNIGIDLIGGEADVNPSQVARNGVVRGNVVIKANADDGDDDAAGIYVDGGRDIVVEGNTVTRCDLGIEVGAENPGIVASGVVVRYNLLQGNRKAGLVFGGFRAAAGRVRGCVFEHNFVAGNGTLGGDDAEGQLWIQFADGNAVTDNVFASAGRQPLLASHGGNAGNTLDRNQWYGRGRFSWNDQEYASFWQYRVATGQDAASTYVDPKAVTGRP